MAGTNKSLAQNNKFRRGGKATKERNKHGVPMGWQLQASKRRQLKLLIGVTLPGDIE
jgi:hypothetical protein